MSGPTKAELLVKINNMTEHIKDLNGQLEEAGVKSTNSMMDRIEAMEELCVADCVKIIEKCQRDTGRTFSIGLIEQKLYE